MRQVAFHWVWGGLAAAAMSMGAQAQSAGAGGIYSCVDAKGQRITSDRPIAACRDREQRVLSPSGVERQRIGPVLTEQEVADQRKLQAQQQRRAQQDIEARRRENSLLARYPDKATHDAERQQQQRPFQALIDLGSNQLAELKAVQRNLHAELERHKASPDQMPTNLLAEVRKTNEAVQAQERFLASVQADSDKVDQRFDDELVRLRALWQRAQAVAAEEDGGLVPTRAAAP